MVLRDLHRPGRARGAREVGVDQGAGPEARPAARPDGRSSRSSSPSAARGSDRPGCDERGADVPRPHPRPSSRGRGAGTGGTSATCAPGPRRCRRRAGSSARCADRPLLCVISEIKRRSPSKGDLAADLDPADAGAASTNAAARAASACSPTTSSSAARPTTCGGPRRRVALPVLRKDFTVSLARRADARLMGADCVLLIAAALDPAELVELHALADRHRPRRARRDPRRARARRRARRRGDAWSASTSATS